MLTADELFRASRMLLRQHYDPAWTRDLQLAGVVSGEGGPGSIRLEPAVPRPGLPSWIEASESVDGHVHFRHGPRRGLP